PGTEIDGVTGTGARRETPNVRARLARYNVVTTTYVAPMPSAVDSVAPARAPPTRAESIVARDIASAATRCGTGIVSPMSGVRSTRSFGRTIPISDAMATTHAGDSRPLNARSMRLAASAA